MRRKTHFAGQNAQINGREEGGAGKKAAAAKKGTRRGAAAAARRERWCAYCKLVTDINHAYWINAGPGQFFRVTVCAQLEAALNRDEIFRLIHLV